MSDTTGTNNSSFSVSVGEIAPPEPIYKRSLKEVPFCPYCDDELDMLDMLNCFAECSCGKWSEWLNMIAKPHHGYIYEPKKKPPTKGAK